MPLSVLVRDRAWRRVGLIRAIRSATGVEVNNGTSRCQLEVDHDVPGVNELSAPGARFEVYRDGTLLNAYRMVETVWRGPGRLGTATIEGSSYSDLLDRLVGYPSPTQTIPSGTAGTFTAAYDVRTGPAETVIKGAITAAANRIGEPVVVYPSQGRGATTRVDLRVGNLADELYPKADAAGVCVRVTPDPGGVGYLVDVVSRGQIGMVLTETMPIVADWELTVKAPGASRVLVGGQGEKVLRTFYALTAGDGREGEWGARSEVFRDARDADDNTVLAARAAETLADTASQYGISLRLVESSGFQWGAGYRLGDQVSVRVRGLLVADWIRQIEWSWTRDGGFTAAPIVGERKGTETQELAGVVGAIVRRDRAGKAGR